MMNEWYWISSLDVVPNQPNTRALRLPMDVPGVFQVRVPYCGCATCVVVIGNVAECGSYDVYGSSATIEVAYPFLFSLLPASLQNNSIIQYLAGIFFSITNDSNKTVQIFSSSPGQCGGSCFCDLKDIYNYAMATVQSVQQLWRGFSMEVLEGMVHSLQNTLSAVLDALPDCNIDQKLGVSFSGIVKTFISNAVKALAPVTRFVDMAIYGERVFVTVYNLVQSWTQQRSYFGAGMYTWQLMKLFWNAGTRALGAAFAADLPGPLLLPEDFLRPGNNTSMLAALPAAPVRPRPHPLVRARPVA